VSQTRVPWREHPGARSRFPLDAARPPKRRGSAPSTAADGAPASDAEGRDRAQPDEDALDAERTAVSGVAVELVGLGTIGGFPVVPPFATGSTLGSSAAGVSHVASRVSAARKTPATSQGDGIWHTMAQSLLRFGSDVSVPRWGLAASVLFRSGAREWEKVSCSRCPRAPDPKPTPVSPLALVWRAAPAAVRARAVGRAPRPPPRRTW
jgi:hypothetical protein